jgi:hypothetical protein
MTFLLQRCRRTIGEEIGIQEPYYNPTATIINPPFKGKTGFSCFFREIGANGPSKDRAANRMQ